MIERRTVEIVLDDPEVLALARNPAEALTEAEIAAAGFGAARVQRIAAGLAAKKAFLQLFPGCSPTDLEILPSDSGRPLARFRGPAPGGLVSLHVSLTHTESRAAALVVVERHEARLVED